LEKQEKGRRFKYKIKIKVMIELTQLEAQVLKNLIDNLYAEAGFSDVDARDIADNIKVNIKSVRGALGSLVKKGIVTIENNGAGFDIIYLNPAHYYLHPSWSKEWWESNEHNKVLIDLNLYLNQTQTTKSIKVMNTNETTPLNKLDNFVGMEFAPMEPVKRGRPVSATSARQARLAIWEAKRASGLEVKRGRPAKAKVVGAINPKQK
jgi:predicted transcriptional regulator